MRVIEQNSPAFLAMYLHRLRKLITSQTDQLFEEKGVLVPSSCVSVMLYLLENKKASITELSEKLGYSHQLINQRLAILLEMTLISKTADPRDRRRSRITLTRRGANQARKLLELLPVTSQAFLALFDEVGIDLSAVITQAGKLLESNPLTNRVARTEKRPTHRIAP